MQSLFASFRVLLGGDVDVAAYVTQTIDGAEVQKIRRQKLAETDRLPAIILELEQDEAVEDLTPPATAGQARMAVVCAAHDSTEAHDLAEAVKELLDGYRGAAGDRTFDPVCWESTDYEHQPADDDSDEADWFLEIPTFDVFYR